MWLYYIWPSAKDNIVVRKNVWPQNLYPLIIQHPFPEYGKVHDNYMYVQ